MKTIILSVGGSIVAPKDLAVSFITQLKEQLISQPNRFLLVIGGGHLARTYMDQCKGAKDEELDWLGIQATRLNAEAVRILLGDAAYERVVTDPTTPVSTDRKIIVAAGWKPGWSTDYCSVLWAQTLGSDLVLNLTNVPQVYDKDPNTHPDAQPLEHLSWDQFQTLVGTAWKPGMNVPFDPIAAQTAKKIQLKVVILAANQLEHYLTNQSFVGTTIK